MPAVTSVPRPPSPLLPPSPLYVEMHSHILQTVSLHIIVIVSIITSHMPISLCVPDERYLTCSSSFECGNIQGITYPFWGMDRPAYCGHPGFHLGCSGDAPVMTISELAYRVLEFNNMSQTLKVARTEYTQNVCSIFPVNSTLDPNLFSYGSNTKNLTLYYGCPTIPSQFSQTTGLFNQFICDINRTNIVGYYLTRNLNRSALHSFAANISSYLKLCNNSIILPASQSALRSMERRPSIESLNFALDQGFELQWTANDNLCDECKLSGGQCGYSTNTSKFTCYCQDRPYATSCEKGSSDEISLAHKIVRVVSFAIYTMIAVTIIVLCSRRGFYRGRTTSFWGKKANRGINIATIIMNFDSLTPKQYTYSDLKKMTNSFMDKLGQGGFGGVYKGELPDGRAVAVNVLKNSKGDGEEFINEVASISKTSHVNIVTLLGFCYERTKRALIYEYMPNGSLDKFIYDHASLHANHHLERKTLYEISIGIARGLEYLHRGCNTRIVHFDIKPHNILLDRDLCPKISDFGLAKLCKREESMVSVTGARGTAGYMAPEVFCRNFGVSYKSDVYSYGMMVLEMVGGRKNIEVGASQSSEIYFPDSIYEHLESGEMSGHDRIITDEEEETIRKMVMVGLWCVQTNPSDRPSMTKVVEMLEGSLQFLQTPPKPFLYSPTRSPEMQLYTTSSTLSTF